MFLNSINLSNFLFYLRIGPLLLQPPDFLECAHLVECFPPVNTGITYGVTFLSFKKIKIESWSTRLAAFYLKEAAPAYLRPGWAELWSQDNEDTAEIETLDLGREAYAMYAATTD